MTYRILELFIKTLLCISILPPAILVRAQTGTNVTCLSTLSWTYNSGQQSPSLVAAYLWAPCTSGQWFVPALQSGYEYSPPTIYANQCSCTTVVYQLISACGLCQGQDFVTWSAWRENCADSITSIASYPLEIPGTTAVPAWAYINIVAEDGFNAIEAHALGDAPESSAGGSTPVPASTTSPASSTFSSTSSSMTPTPTDNGANTNTGAIAGGAIGGVVGLGLIICLAIFLMKRQSTKSKHLAPSAEFSNVMPPGIPVRQNFDPATIGFTGDYSHGAPNVHQVETGGNNGVAVGYSGSPWSQLPTEHTLAPSYSSVYTPSPGPGTGQAYGFTPPPGAMESAPSVQGYSHSHSSSGVTGYSPTAVAYQNTGPYGGHEHKSSYTHRSSGLPEL